MVERKQYLILAILAALSLVLVFANVLLVNLNRAKQSEANERQQFIQQSIQLEGLYQQMIKALAELSAKNNDPQLKNVLAQQGITFSVNQNPVDSVIAAKKN